MYTLGVVSDSHSHKDNLKKAAQRLMDVDAIVHLGDHLRDSELLAQLTGKPVHAVRGNCDPFFEGDGEATLAVEGVRVLLTHGDRQNVKYGLFRLNLYALEKECQLVLYGHTHVPDLAEARGVTMLNPGALKNGSYAVVALDDGAIRPEFHTLDE